MDSPIRECFVLCDKFEIKLETTTSKSKLTKNHLLSKKVKIPSKRKLNRRSTIIPISPCEIRLQKLGHSPISLNTEKSKQSPSKQDTNINLLISDECDRSGTSKTSKQNRNIKTKRNHQLNRLHEIWPSKKKKKKTKKSKKKLLEKRKRGRPAKVHQENYKSIEDIESNKMLKKPEIINVPSVHSNEIESNQIDETVKALDFKENSLPTGNEFVEHQNNISAKASSSALKSNTKYSTVDLEMDDNSAEQKQKSSRMYLVASQKAPDGINGQLIELKNPILQKTGKRRKKCLEVIPFKRLRSGLIVKNDNNLTDEERATIDMVANSENLSMSQVDSNKFCQKNNVIGEDFGKNLVVNGSEIEFDLLKDANNAESADGHSEKVVDCGRIVGNICQLTVNEEFNDLTQVDKQDSGNPLLMNESDKDSFGIEVQNSENVSLILSNGENEKIGRNIDEHESKTGLESCCEDDCVEPRSEFNVKDAGRFCVSLKIVKCDVELDSGVSSKTGKHSTNDFIEHNQRELISDLHKDPKIPAADAKEVQNEMQSIEMNVRCDNNVETVPKSQFNNDNQTATADCINSSEEPKPHVKHTYPPAEISTSKSSENESITKNSNAADSLNLDMELSISTHTIQKSDYFIHNSDDSINTNQNSAQKHCNSNKSSVEQQQRKRQKSVLRQLESDLSPKYVELSSPKDGRVSRYGRQQRLKEQADFLPSDILYPPRCRSKSVTKFSPEKYNPHLRMTPPSVQSTISKSYVSPIDKLIEKNKILSLLNSPKSQTKNPPKNELLTELPSVSKMLDFDIIPIPLSLSKKEKTPRKHSLTITESETVTVPPLVPIQMNREPFEEEHLEPLQREQEINLGIELPALVPISSISSVPESMDDQNEDKAPVENPINLNNCPSVCSDSAKGSSIISDLDVEWKIGQILWARIGNFPYWPCLIYPVDDNGTFYIPHKQNFKIHVRFFADRGRRSWVFSQATFPYLGLDDYEAKRNELPANLKRSDSRIKAFTIKPSQLQLWMDAVREADSTFKHPQDKRKDAFDELLKSNKSKKPINPHPHRRLSLPSKDISFVNLFNTYSQHITSTPRRLILDSCDHTPISHSPTLEIPPYKALDRISTENNLNSTNKDDEKESKTNRLHEYLLSLPSNAQAPSQTPLNSSIGSFTNGEPVESIKLNDDMELRELICPTVDDLAIINKDRKFKYMYRQILENVCPPDKTIEALYKQLAQKIWMLKLMTDSENGGRKRIDPNNRRSSVRMQLQRFGDGSNATITEIGSENGPSVSESKELKIAQQAERLAAKELLEDEQIERYIMKKHPKNLLFKGLTRKFVCKICLKPDGVVRCGGKCGLYIHSNCVGDGDEAGHSGAGDELKDNVNAAKIILVTGDGPLLEVDSKSNAEDILDSKSNICPDCSANESKPLCFVCNTINLSLSKPLKCTEKSCGLHFHIECLKYWPQYKLIFTTEEQNLLCPCHVCHTCISDDPRGRHYQIDNKKLIRCVKCPATYHIDSCCIPAGSVLLTLCQMVCPRHQQEVKKPVNANWCFICAKGGSLICCETCPTAFHLDCLKIASPDKYICEECETGRMPLYGEIVWSKFSSHRWWPSIILPPTEVPENVLVASHRRHDFCVRFFGSNNFSWLSRGFVFLYQEGDSDCSRSDGAEEKRSFKMGLAKAKKWFERITVINRENVDPDKEKMLIPFPYIKLKSNRPVRPVKFNEPDEESDPVCDCKQTDEEPCGPNSGCINRFIMTECNANLCLAGEKCQNQLFQKRLYPNLIERPIEGKGWGLITLDNIRAGDFVIEYVGELINHEEFERRVNQKLQIKDKNYYFLTVTRDLLIDAGPKGNLARFINHSCDPNCETQKWQVNGNTRVGLFALKDIPMNTELTFNYLFECIGEKNICQCGAKKCAGFIGAKYIEEDTEKLKNTVNKGRKRKLNDATYPSSLNGKSKKVKKTKKIDSNKSAGGLERKKKEVSSKKTQKANNLEPVVEVKLLDIITSESPLNGSLNENDKSSIESNTSKASTNTRTQSPPAKRMKLVKTKKVFTLDETMKPKKKQTKGKVKDASPATSSSSSFMLKDISYKDQCLVSPTESSNLNKTKKIEINEQIPNNDSLVEENAGRIITAIDEKDDLMKKSLLSTSSLSAGSLLKKPKK